MDCYSEYKYQQQHPYYSSNNTLSMRFGSVPHPGDNHYHHHPQQQQQQPPFYDGFARQSNHHHHPHHYHGQGNYPTPFESSNENNSQFYYSNMHPTAPPPPIPSPYGNHHQPQPQQQQHSYDSYRNFPPNYRYHHYGYHHHPYPPPSQFQNQHPAHFYPQYNGTSQPDHFNHYPAQPSPHMPSTSIPTTSASSQGDFNTTSSSASSSPTTNTTTTTTNIRSNDFPSSLINNNNNNNNNDAHEGHSSNDKSIDSEMRHADLSTNSNNDNNNVKINEEGEESANTNNNNNDNSSSNSNNVSEVQQVNSQKAQDSSSSSSPTNITSSTLSQQQQQQINNENSNMLKEDEENVKNEKAINNNNNNNNANNNNDNNNNNNNNNGCRIDEEQEVAKKLKNESYNENENCKENHLRIQQQHEDTSATGYLSEHGRINKIPRESEKTNAPAHINNRLLPDHSNSNASAFNDSGNVIQNEYLYGLSQMQEHLNISIALLTKTEQNFAMNITNLLIQYGESWIGLTNELFERDGFIVDIKNLYRFTSNIKSRIKFDISRSIKEFSAGKITRSNIKLYQKFLSDLFGILDQHIQKIKSAITINDDLIECWDYFKTVYLEIGFDATNVLSKWSFTEIERLYKSFYHLKHKITKDIKHTKNLLYNEVESPLDNRVIVNLYPHNFNDRSLTPIAKLSTIGYNMNNNHHYNMELSHNYPSQKHHHHHHHHQQQQQQQQRYPMSWYSHEYYNNWILNPDDRRHFPDSQSFFSSMRSNNNNKKNHFHPEKNKAQQQEVTSPSPNKRAKRKPKVEEPLPPVKKDPNKELIKNVTPLPGFLQTFGQTEIGKFSEAFYISSDSPHYQYNNNNESDVDSPQPFSDFDSLDGPIPRSFYMCGANENEFDSPISSFSEIICTDF